jgi:hypothetical protein
MRSKLIGGFAVCLAMLAWGTSIQAQPLGAGFNGTSSEGLIDGGGLPGTDGNAAWLSAPLGDPGKPGVFTFAEATILTQSWTLGNQLVAWRGLLDTTGVISGTPGTYLGSGARALSTGDLGRSSWAPGINLGIGYKLDDGSTVHFRVMKQAQQDYNATASGATPFARSNANLSDTFLTAGVFNFPPQYAGPRRKTAYEGTRVGDIVDIFGNVVILNGQPLLVGRTVPEGAFYGIWNGASVMTISYTTDYTEAEFGGRVPLFESRTSKIYGLGGMRFHHFLERFNWRTTSFSVDGSAGPQDSAEYRNNLSQRLYGPYMGCAHDVYLGNRFSVSAEMTGGVFANVIKRRAKYSLTDESIQNKRSTNDLGLAATGGAAAHLWWYPTKGVQVRVGYTANTFWNTERMKDPIAFNYGALDPVYGTQYFRIIHGLEFGFSLFF